MQNGMHYVKSVFIVSLVSKSQKGVFYMFSLQYTVSN